MNDTSSDDILLLKQRQAEQEALNRALLEKLRRMNFGSRSVGSDACGAVMSGLRRFTEVSGRRYR